MNRQLALIFHVVAFVYYAFSLTYNILYVKDPAELKKGHSLLTHRGYGGKFKYMTFLNFMLQTFFFGLSVVNDVYGTHVRPSDKGQKKSDLQKFTNTLLASIVYPVGSFVVLTFWSIYAVDRELVFPKRLDGIIPPWINHVMHTGILPVLLMEKYLVYHEYPRRRKGLTILLTFALAYLVWILWIAYYADIWVYPILQVLQAHHRVIFISVLLAFFISIYILGESINKFIWRKELSAAARSSKGQKSTKSTAQKKQS